MIKNNQNGNALIQVIMAFGLISVLGVSVASMVQDLNKSLKFVQAKQETLDVKSRLTTLFMKKNCCPLAASTINDLVLNNPLQSEIDLKFIYRDCDPTRNDTSASNIILQLDQKVDASSIIKPSSMKLKQITQDNPSLAPNQYQAKVEVRFDHIQGQNTAMAPVNIDLTLLTSSTGGSPDKKVLSCNSSTSTADKVLPDPGNLAKFSFGLVCETFKESDTADAIPPSDPADCAPLACRSDFEDTGVSCVTTPMSVRSRFIPALGTIAVAGKLKSCTRSCNLTYDKSVMKSDTTSIPSNGQASYRQSDTLMWYIASDRECSFIFSPNDGGYLRKETLGMVNRVARSNSNTIDPPGATPGSSYPYSACLAYYLKAP